MIELGRTLDARGQIDRIAYDRDLHFFLAAEVADDGLAAVDADAKLQRLHAALVPFRVEPGEGHAHFQGRPDSGAGVGLRPLADDAPQWAMSPSRMCVGVLLRQRGCWPQGQR